MDELLKEIRELKELVLKPELKVYTLNKANEAFGVGRVTLEKGIASGDLKYMKTGNTVYMTESAIKEFLESNVELV